MTEKCLRRLLRDLGSRSRQSGKLWTEDDASKYGEILSQWTDEFGEMVVTNALDGHTMPLDSHLREIAARLRPGRIQPDEPPDRSNALANMLAGFLEFWEREREGEAIPEWVNGYLRKMQEPRGNSEPQETAGLTKEKRAQTIAEVQAKNPNPVEPPA